MRLNIVHIGADELTYEIRGIIEIAKKFEVRGMKMIWENIGDPVQKGHTLPEWIKDEIRSELDNDFSYGYCPTKGEYKTRDFLADINNEKQGVQITSEDILFFNGLGDAISTFYHFLKREARVIGPSPAYSTHSSAEAAHCGHHHITYSLDPDNNWQPDLDELYNKVKFNESISGILILNPDNPTGAVFAPETLKRIIEIADEFDLFVVADEIYHQTVYSDEKYLSLADIIGDRPGIAMKGISKEFPWPGSRCGWLEFYNTDKDKNFARFVKTLNDAKMLEVCSTTLPQRIIPQVLSDIRYSQYQKGRNAFFKKRAKQSYDIMSGIKGIKVNQTQGAFYFTVVFDEGYTDNTRSLNISDENYEIIKPELDSVEFDKRFVLFLLAKTGICTVPLSGFNTNLQGFRMTLLEKDDEKFSFICNSIKDALEEFLS